MLGVAFKQVLKAYIIPNRWVSPLPDATSKSIPGTPIAATAKWKHVPNAYPPSPEWRTKQRLAVRSVSRFSRLAIRVQGPAIRLSSAFLDLHVWIDAWRDVLKHVFLAAFGIAPRLLRKQEMLSA